MEFKNTENECFDTVCGKKVWKSRNVAVCVCVIRTNPLDKTKIQVLGVKRGEAMTHSGKWCFPCGYLDWDETVPMAAVREVYEEAGIEADWKDLDFVEVDSNPAKFGQNVTIHFVYYYSGEEEPSNAKASKDEVEEARWFSMEEASEEEWAFDHGNRIEKLIQLFEAAPSEESGESEEKPLE